METQSKTPIRTGRRAARLGLLPVRRRLGHDLSAPAGLPDAHARRRPGGARPHRGSRGGDGVLHEDGLRLVVGPVPAPQADRRRRLLDRGRRAAARRPRRELGPGARDPLRRPRRQGHPHLAARRAARRPRAARATGAARSACSARWTTRAPSSGRSLAAFAPEVRLRRRAHRSSCWPRFRASRRSCSSCSGVRETPAPRRRLPRRALARPARHAARALLDRHRHLRPLHARELDRRVPPAARARLGSRRSGSCRCSGRSSTA